MPLFKALDWFSFHIRRRRTSSTTVPQRSWGPFSTRRCRSIAATWPSCLTSTSSCPREWHSSPTRSWLTSSTITSKNSRRRDRYLRIEDPFAFVPPRHESLPLKFGQFRGTTFFGYLHACRFTYKKQCLPSMLGQFHVSKVVRAIGCESFSDKAVMKTE